MTGRALAAPCPKAAALGHAQEGPAPHPSCMVTSTAGWGQEGPSGSNKEGGRRVMDWAPAAAEGEGLDKPKTSRD